MNPFQKLWSAGYRLLVPIVPPGAAVSERSTLAKRPEAIGKAVGFRGGDGKWRGFDWLRHETTEEDLHRWHEMGAGVGIRTGKQADGTWLIGVDADTLDERLAAVINGEMMRRFGTVPARIGRAPKVLYAVRCSGPVKYARIEFGSSRERIELLSDCRQFVGYGVHPVTRAPYRWVQPLKPWSEMPVVKPEELL